MVVEQRPLIYGQSLAALADWCKGRGEPAFRARQIWKWLYQRRAASAAGMTDLPAATRHALESEFEFQAVSLASSDAASGPDAGTRKLLLGLRDSACVETVLIPARGHLTVCVSSQVGCAFACAFCASGQAGFDRNLEAGEMVGQVLAAASAAGAAPGNVVFMGMGEPLDNYDAVLAAIRILNDPDGLRIGARRITVSTCGLAPAIRRLSDEGMQLELSVSLHAADDALRSRLMPVNRRYPLAELMDACSVYIRKTDRIITFEYTLIGGVNDGPGQARALARLIGPLKCRVNLIPLSPVEEFAGQAGAPARMRDFALILDRARINVTVRKSRGAGVRAACGQLRKRHLSAGQPNAPE